MSAGGTYSGRVGVNGNNWQKATRSLFTKRGGVEFRITDDKNRSQGSGRNLIPQSIYSLVSCTFKKMGKCQKREEGDVCAWTVENVLKTLRFSAIHLKAERRKRNLRPNLKTLLLTRTFFLQVFFFKFHFKI